MHEGGFDVQTLPGGEIWFIYPDGRTLPASPDGRFRGNSDTIRADNYNNGLDITSETLPTLWRGEVMDQDLAQLGMQSLE